MLNRLEFLFIIVISTVVSNISFGQTVTVRIGIADRCSLVEFESETEVALFQSGEDSAKAIPVILNKGKYSVLPSDTSSAEETYRIGVGSFEDEEYEQMEEMVVSLATRGYKVDVRRIGKPVVIGDTEYHSEFKNIVLVGGFSSEQEANEESNKLNKIYNTWIYEEIRNPSKGTVKIYDNYGNEKFRGNKIILAGRICVQNVKYGKGFAWGGKQDRIYEGKLEFGIDKTGNLMVVDVLDVEEYLRGVVPSEMPTSWNYEALKAQAVCARTKVIAGFGKQHVTDGYDYCADVHCQVYAGVLTNKDNAWKAIEETKGEILFYDTELVDVVYHSSCGGRTENNEVVWPGTGVAYLRGVSDLVGDKITDYNTAELNAFLSEEPQAYCNGKTRKNNFFRWKVEYSAQQLETIVKKKYDVGDLQDLEVLERGASGRVSRVKITGTRNDYVVSKDPSIRAVFGGLKSSLFIIKKEKDILGKLQKVSFLGGGFGHGVGMCQFGADGMAESGHDYKAILKHYFSGAEVRKVY